MAMIFASLKTCYRLNDCRIEGRNKKQPILDLFSCPKVGVDGARSEDFFGGLMLCSKKIGGCVSKMWDPPPTLEMFVIHMAYDSKFLRP